MFSHLTKKLFLKEIQRLRINVDNLNLIIAVMKKKLERLREESQKSLKEMSKVAEYYKEKTAELFKQIEELKEPPNKYAIFWRMHPGGKPDEVDVVEVGCPGVYKVKFFVSGMDPKTIKSGAQVLLAEGLVIGVINELWPWGEEVAFCEKLSDDIVLVSANDDRSKEQCYLSPELKGTAFKKGDRLLNCRGIIVKVLPKIEGKEHFSDIEEITNFNWSQVGGISRSVRHIQRILLPFKEAKVYKEVLKGKNMPKGLILHGPAGCGKTLVAKCIAADLARTRGMRCYFMPIVASELSDKYVGETSKNIRDVFFRAKEKDGLVLIFLDELDSLFRRRDQVMEHESWMAEQVGQFCGILDGVDPLGNILVIAATNLKNLIDQAILRPGRLGIDIYVPGPSSSEDIREILEIYLTEDLPFAGKYLENEQYEYVDYFGSGKKEIVVLNKDRKLVRNHFIDEIIKRLLYIGPPIKLLISEDGDDEELIINNVFGAEIKQGEKEIRFKDWLSGAILASIVDLARTSALERYVRLKKQRVDCVAELKKKDFYKAVDEEFQRLKNSFKTSERKSIDGFRPA